MTYAGSNFVVLPDFNMQICANFIREIHTGSAKNCGRFKIATAFDRINQFKRLIANSKEHVMRIFLIPDLCKSDFPLLRYDQPNTTPGFGIRREIFRTGPTPRARSQSKLHSFS